MSKNLHVYSPEVRSMAKVLFPNSPNPSVKQQTTALFFIRLHDVYPESAEYQLYTLPKLAEVYRPGYSGLPLNEKKAAQQTVKKLLSFFATLSSRLPLVIVPVPDGAWDLADEGNYPPPVYIADKLYRGQWKIAGAHVGMTVDGSIPTAYTNSNRRKGNGVLKAQNEREQGWTVQGMISDDICHEREIPTQKQLVGDQPLLTK